MKFFITGLLFVCCCMLTVARAGEGTVVPPPDLSQVRVLDLETAQRIALQSNPDMAAAQARIEQARARVRQAVAAWWPSIDLNATGSRVRRSDSAYAVAQFFPSISGQSTDRIYDQSAASLQATWVLFDGFYRSFSQQQAEFGEKGLVAARRDAQRQLVSAVAEAFFNAQLAQTKVDIAKADEKFYLRQLEDARNRYDVGAGAWGDVLNIKVQLNSARTALMLGRREFEAAGYGLASLLGIPDAAFPANVKLSPLEKDFDATDPEVDADALIRIALQNRPDVRRVEMQLKAAEAATGEARASFYPRIQIAGVYNGTRQGDFVLSGEDFGDTISLNMAWNLFSGGADRARLFEARQKRREAVYTMDSLRNQVASQVRQALAYLAAAREQVVLQRESVTLVKENRDLARNEYEAGETSLVRLNEAQRDLTTTYGRLAQALVSYHLARQRLLAATGQNLAPFRKK
ncbi:MAG TPA: TolC family protein [Desulfobulbus sp.]|nr:TolC family protein [Desulfobulbus sp.]